MVCYGEVKTFGIQSYFSCISKGFCLLTAEFHVEGHIMIFSMTLLCLSDPTISVLFNKLPSHFIE